MKPRLSSSHAFALPHPRLLGPTPLHALQGGKPFHVYSTDMEAVFRQVRAANRCDATTEQLTVAEVQKDASEGQARWVLMLRRCAGVVLPLPVWGDGGQLLRWVPAAP